MPGVKVIGLESLGEQEVGHDRPADFEADLAAMAEAAEMRAAVNVVPLPVWLRRPDLALATLFPA